MAFIVILVAAALLVASAAAFFSVYGLAQVFAGAFISVIVMGVALELGKLVAASFLYRHWDTISKALKIYLVSAVIILMGITSMGISGYLVAAYQSETTDFRTDSTILHAQEQELERHLARKAEMDRQISELPSDYVAARQKLVRTFEPEYATINPRIAELQRSVAEIKSKNIQTEAKIGPIVFISKVLGASPDNAIFWLIFLIVLVFDPLAVALTLAANIAITKRNNTIPGEELAPVQLAPVSAEAPPETEDVIESVRARVVRERNIK